MLTIYAMSIVELRLPLNCDGMELRVYTYCLPKLIRKHRQSFANEMNVTKRIVKFFIHSNLQGPTKNAQNRFLCQMPSN
jgi:hypothetical protein